MALASPIKKVLGGLRKRLFSSYLDGVITVLVLLFLVWIIPPLLDWLIFSADINGSTRAACSSDGACWVFIKERLQQFIYGFYPDGELWRVHLSAAVIVVAIAGALSGKLGSRSRWLILASTVVPVGIWVLLRGSFWGFSVGLTEVDTAQWGGLLVTVIIAFVGILFSLPLGMVLALARRSTLPVFRVVATIFIEAWRGVPLITVLFMSSVMFPIFIPEGWEVNKLLRALAGVLFFASAYMAEVIRGGLQALPKGQYEAGDSLALSYGQVQRLIILPQALRHVIPGIVNNFIALLKDTTLVYTIGMFDLLGMVQTANADPDWLGFATEGYVFAGLIFWLLCFSMSRYSLSVERATRVDHKR